MPTVVETVTDSGSGSDALAFSRDVAVADTAGGSNVDAVAYDFSGAAADTAQGADSATNGLVTGAAIAEAIVIADVLELTRTLPVSDAAAGADAMALSRVIAISDSAAGTDATALSGSVVELVADLVAAADAIAQAFSYAVADNAGAVDALTLGRTLSLTDSANASTSEAPSAVRTQEVSETATATDALAARLTATYSVVDGARASDSPISGKGEAFWTNLQSMAAARWTAQPFNSYAMHNGALIAAGPDGIAAFGADTDAGVKIVARVRGDLTDFGDVGRKVYDAAYVGAIASGLLRMRIATENGVYNYDAPLGASKLSNVYFQLGRGLFSRYARFELTNPDGAAFNFRDAVVNVAPTKRVR
jgi:hypothetical protein